MANYGPVGKYDGKRRHLRKNTDYYQESSDLIPDLKESDFVFSCESIHQWDNLQTGEIIYADRGKKDVTLVVGESWTYGDSLTPFVKCAEGKDNLSYRISKIFSSKVSEWLDTDLLQCATAGQSNIDILKDLDDGLKWIVNNKSYERIFVLIQITSPGRCSRHNNDWFHFGLENLFQQNIPHKLDTPYDFEGWFKEYERIMFKRISEILSKYNVEGLVWKNFNEFISVDDNTHDNIKIIETPAQRYVCELCNIQTELPLALEMDFFERIPSYVNLDVSKERLIEEMNLIDSSYSDLQLSKLNNWHFNESGHWIWFLKIRETCISKGLGLKKYKREINYKNKELI